MSDPGIIIKFVSLCLLSLADLDRERLINQNKLKK